MKVVLITKQSPARCRCSRSCHSMDQSYPCKTKTSQETERSLRKFLEPSEKPKVIYTDNSLEFGNLVNIYHGIIEPQHLIDLRHLALLSERRNFSSIVIIRIVWKTVGWFYGMLLLSTKCPRPPGQRGNSVWKTIWRTIQRVNDSFWVNGWLLSELCTRSVQLHQFGKEVILAISLGYELIARGIWKADILIADLQDLDMDASESYSRRINAKEVLITQKGDEFNFPIADGTANLSGRNQEFREPILRQHRSVWRQDLSGGIQGESEGFQPTETSSTRVSEPSSIGKPIRVKCWVRRCRSPKRFLVDTRWLLFSSSQWTSSSTLCAEGRIIPYATEIHWSY